MSFYTSVSMHFDDILLRGVDSTGQRIQKKVKYKPTLYISTDKPDARFKTIKGLPVESLRFDSIKEARDFRKKYEGVDNFKIYGLTNYPYTFINEQYKGLIEWDINKVRILFFDIEVISDQGFPKADQAAHEVVAISMRMGSKIYLLGNQPYEPDSKDVEYFHCKTEEELLHKFLELWRELDPDVVSGWNVNGFDIPYMVNRLENVLGEGSSKRLSPWGLIGTRQVTLLGREQTFYEPVGLAILDYLDLYKKFTFKESESFKLDAIAFTELGEKKIDYSEYETIQGLYRKNYKLFLDYNLKDTLLVHKLDLKLKFIEQALSIAYLAKINYLDAFTSVRMWDVIIHNFLLERNIVVPPMVIQNKEGQIVGAYVKDPVAKGYDWVASFDVNSLYPMLIIQYNISPETLISSKYMSKYSIDEIVDGAFEKDDGIQQLISRGNCIAGNGVVFSKTKKGFLPELMDQFYSNRVVYKKKYIEAEKAAEKATGAEKKRLEVQAKQYYNLQLAFKIILNSAYGSLSNVYFRYFDVRLAEAVTYSGQMALKSVEKHINKYMNNALKTNKDYIIAIDTDSLYIELADIVAQTINSKDPKVVIPYLDRLCKEVFEKEIDRSFNQLAKYTNAMAQRMVMKREVLADRGIWIAKKRYILNMYDKEGVRYDEPHLKMMGVEAIRTTTPYVCREKIKAAFKIMMQKTESDLQSFIKDFKTEFFALPFEDIARPSNCNNLAQYSDKSQIYKKGTPIHVKGALIYNHMLKEYGLEKQFVEVQEGEKIKYTYLKLPNPAQSTVISTPSMLPRQFGLDKYIDYDTQFEKVFLDPITKISKLIGWDSEKRATLSDLWD